MLCWVIPETLSIDRVAPSLLVFICSAAAEFCSTTALTVSMVFAISSLGALTSSAAADICST